MVARMTKRTVQMSFRDECISEFAELFESCKQRIRAFEGCAQVELWQDTTTPNVFFT